MTAEQRRYARLSRSQRLAFWQQGFAAIAAGPESLWVREQVLIDLWQRLHRYEPDCSTLPALMLVPYFELRESMARLEAQRQERLALTPDPHDGEVEGLRPMPAEFELREEQVVELERELERQTSAALEPSVADLARDLRNGYLNTYGPERIVAGVSPAATGSVRWLRYWLKRAGAEAG